MSQRDDGPAATGGAGRGHGCAGGFLAGAFQRVCGQDRQVRLRISSVGFPFIRLV